MKGIWFQSLAVILAIGIALPPAGQISYAAQQYSQYSFSNSELDQILGPVALYPDPLLAQILPAASFGDQIAQAQQLLNGRVDEGLIESQNWDPSVKAIAHYPTILSKMANQPDWTAALGQAYVTQEPEVARSIQNLRVQAQQAGLLQSSPQQQVIVEPDFISIEPAEPQVIYIPQYEPAAIWGYPYGYPLAAGLIGFGSGFAIGSWLNRDWDWHGRGPYYHGWRGGGWVGASRAHVDTHNRNYVNDQFRNVHVNRDVVNRNVGTYRSQIQQNPTFRAKPSPGATGREGAFPGAPPAVAPQPRGDRPRQVTPRGQVAPIPAPPQGNAPGAVAPAPNREKPRPAAPPQNRVAPPTALPRGEVGPRPVAPRQGIAPGAVVPAPNREKPRPAAPPQNRVAPAPTAPPRGEVAPRPVAPPQVAPQNREKPQAAPPQGRGAPQGGMAPQGGRGMPQGGGSHGGGSQGAPRGGGGGGGPHGGGGSGPHGGGGGGGPHR